MIKNRINTPLAILFFEGNLTVIHNDVLRSVRYMLKLNPLSMGDLVELGGGKVSEKDMTDYLKSDEEEGFQICPPKTFAQFLNGLIIFKRGKDETRPPMPLETPTNNMVLKKLRVAFELREEDILALLQDVGLNLSKSELSAFFRKEGHGNFRECGNQVLRNFLKGLAQKVRK